MKKLFRTDKEIATELVGLAVNKKLRLGRYLFLFPYEVRGRTFRTTVYFKLLCWLVTLLLTGCCIWFVAISYRADEPFSFLFWGPMLTSYLTLPVNQILMHTKKRTLNDFLSNLQKCRPYLKVDDKKDTIGSFLPIFITFAIYLAFWLVTVSDELNLLSFIFLYTQLGSFLSVAMVEQFSLLLSLVRRQLARTNLLSDMDQDALIAAAVNLNEVFSFHLLVTITVVFVSLLGKIYSTITIEEGINIYNLIVVMMQGFPIWRVVSSCQVFAKEVEKSYNRMYSHLLNQKHRIEKRLELHLSMRERFVISAGGMFDLDYQLIRGMITTAVTYVVVLLQFTPHKD